MKQVDNNLAVFRLALALKRYDDSNPDVGMGSSLNHFIDQAGRELRLEPSDYDAKHVFDLMRADR
ncbi:MULTISPECIES: hypothetical protein [unclassified Ensifer]|uniref:hypothetical protein n=1 Tax=unclassified Ensifer TaxID=2633371 RepID=UPI000813606C|nr:MULTISPECIES: hypothetical protein [unclassified Ensifer]OCP21947.1 hypothetical protein BC361_25600 [Ensifer sp. LC54]OCP23273.1 hypothetical protein BC363_25165 [Ensifer sp. LC384]